MSYELGYNDAQLLIEAEVSSAGLEAFLHDAAPKYCDPESYRDGFQRRVREQEDRWLVAAGSPGWLG